MQTAVGAAGALLCLHEHPAALPAQQLRHPFRQEVKPPPARRGRPEKRNITCTLLDKMDLSYQNLSLIQYLSFYFSLISTFYFMNAII